VSDQVRAEVAHLVRRAAFGAPPDEVDALAELGYEGAVDALCRLDEPDAGAESVAPPFIDTDLYLRRRQGGEDDRQAADGQARRERTALAHWWVRRMVAADIPLREKLTFHWHDHFATGDKVRSAGLHARQRDLLHALGAGRFPVLVEAVARDPAMLVWLDGRLNVVGRPNENFARELLELFVLGHGAGPAGDHSHGTAPGYDEDDVAEAARALTGWRVDAATGTSTLVADLHDHGTKTVLGRTGALGLAEVVEVATAHPACAPHVVAGLWSRLARPARPDDPVVVELAVLFADDGGDVAALIRRILLHPEFRAESCRQRLVRSPVEHLVGLCRTLRVDVDDTSLAGLSRQGQVLFDPPDVDGWTSGAGWLSTSTARSRLAAAIRLARAAAPGLVDPGPGGRADHVARLLGVERWTPTTSSSLEAAPDLATAVGLAAAAPEYVVC
jgi:uncharacterized protein (DUF1800 family)